MFLYDLSDWSLRSLLCYLLELLPGFLPCILTFFQPLQLVISVVDFLLKSVSEILNTCAIFQFHATGFSSRMPYPLTWAC